jgi:hypothetical protein
MEVEMRTRHIEHVHPLDERLAQEAVRLREAAKVMKPGATRQQMLRKAREAEIAAHITSWISSPGLQRPE